jgi:DNA-directed RNA polymerase subunit RPC12/RpoP
MSKEISKDALLEMIRGGIKETLEALEAKKAAAAAKPQENHIDHTCGCPDCYCGLIEKMNKTSDYACRDCGLPLGNEVMMKRIEKCPNCGSKNAPRKVER